MGELLLCNEPIGAMPYYIEGISLNIYTIEELSYYIYNNVYLLDADLMNEELCTWLEKEIGMRSLAEKLREEIRKKRRLSGFVELILRESFYLTESQIRETVETISQMEEKTEFECDKMRADRLMEKEKYLSAIYAYKHLLASDDAQKADPIVLGNIYHNFGTAYARLFLFKEAAEYYSKAFEKNHDPESVKELLICYRCMGDEVGFQNAALENQVDSLTMDRIRQELSSLSRNDKIVHFEQKIDGLYERYESGDKAEYNQAVSDYLTNWKAEYRRICRV